MNNSSICKNCGEIIYRRKNGEWGSNHVDPLQCRRPANWTSGWKGHSPNTGKENNFDRLYLKLKAHKPL